MALLRTILILIIIYYVVQIFTRYILPALFTSYMDDKMNEFSTKQKKQQKKTAKREGEITIDYIPEKSSKNKPGKGEYVDYEEVKE
ncbi:MAG: DUF4834 family protein [Bacteroidales bacterium]|nr:DUF4834 family protein [Bacteroidales bacterium]